MQVFAMKFFYDVLILMQLMYSVMYPLAKIGICFFIPVTADVLV